MQYIRSNVFFLSLKLHFQVAKDKENRKLFLFYSLKHMLDIICMGAIKWGTRPLHFFRQWGYNMPCPSHFSLSVSYCIGFTPSCRPHILQQNCAYDNMHQGAAVSILFRLQCVVLLMIVWLLLWCYYRCHFVCLRLLCKKVSCMLHKDRNCNKIMVVTFTTNC